MVCLGSSFVPGTFWFSGWLGLTGAWQVEKKKKKVAYCFSAVGSCCYATSRMSLSPGCIQSVFPAHSSARSVYALPGGHVADFLQDCRTKYVSQVVFWGLLWPRTRRHACTAFLCCCMHGTPVWHRQTKRADGCVPGGGMILPSNMLRLQKGGISSMEKPQAMNFENIWNMMQRKLTQVVCCMNLQIKKFS